MRLRMHGMNLNLGILRMFEDTVSLKMANMIKFYISEAIFSNFCGKYNL